MRENALQRRSVLSLLATMPLFASHAGRALAATDAFPIAPLVRQIRATASRQVEVSTWLAKSARRGTIAFSHGFGSSPRFYPDFIEAWTGAGYDVIAPLHVDSREYANSAAFKGPANWAARIEDMRAVAGLIKGPYVAAGHSYGALNALVLGGAAAVVPPGITRPLSDKRVAAVIAFSPPGPMPTLIAESGFEALARPAMVQTGTRDILPSTANDPESWRAHFTAFAKSPASGDHYGLILDGVDHFFGGLICDPSKTGPDQHAQLQLACRASLAFLERYAPHAAPSTAAPSFPINPALRIYRR